MEWDLRTWSLFQFVPQILASYNSLAGKTWTSVLNLSHSNDLPLGSPTHWFCMFCWKKTYTVAFLLFLMLGDLEPWGCRREMFLMCCIVSLVIEVIVMRKPWTTAMTNRNILTTHSHWMLLKKSPLRQEQRRTLYSLLRIQGGTQLSLDWKVSWFDLSCASGVKSTLRFKLRLFSTQESVSFF